MGDGENPEYGARGLSAGQMALLFLAGAAVCGMFFSAGFIVGYNQKSSAVTPLTEKVTDPSDIPPVVTQDPPNPYAEPFRKGSNPRKPATEDAQAEPLRPQPRSSADRAEGTQSELRIEPHLPPAVVPPRAGGPPAVSTAASTHIPAGEAGSGFMIQVAATGTKPDAEKMVNALKSLDYRANLVTPEQAHSSDNLYRVLVGPFTTRENADKVRAKLIHDGFKNPFIKH